MFSPGAMKESDTILYMKQFQTSSVLAGTGHEIAVMLHVPV